MCRWTPDVPQAPVTVDACKPRLSDEIANIRAQVRRGFAPEADGGRS